MRIVLLGAAALAVAVAGCAGDGVAPPAGPTPTPGGVVRIDQVQDRIFTSNCLFAGCHSAGNAAGGLVLEPGRSFGNLVGVAAENVAAARAGLERVTAFDADASFLLIKLTNPGGGQGSVMPIGQPHLSQSDIELVRSWIVDGALDAVGATPLPSATPTAPPTASATPTITLTPLPSATPTVTPMGTLAPSASPTLTATPSATPTMAVVTLGAIQEGIFNRSCAVSFCHSTTGAPLSGNLDLSPGKSFVELVGVSARLAGARDLGLLRVKPGDPDASFLQIKICHLGAASGLCSATPLPEEFGNRMPMVGPSLTDAQLAAIRSWILRGAPND